MKKVLIGGTLIDGTDSAATPDAIVVLENAKIRDVGQSPPLAFDPQQVEVIDLSGKTILPGLIDAHVHMCVLEPRPGDEKNSLTEASAAVGGVLNARTALLNGVTTLRDAGSPFLTNIKIRDMIQKGYIPGPRVVACGNAISMTGGHGEGFNLEVDSPDEARKAVRQMRKAGADFIKLMANGLSVNSPELTVAEMRAAVEAAHNAEKKVAAHASVWQAVENALAAGVDTIEHGYTLNEALVQAMLDQGTILVPTLATLLRLARFGNEDPAWKDSMDAIRRRLETAMDSLSFAYQSGVKFALGTDGSVRPMLQVGEIDLEFEALLEVGLSNMEAIRAATSVAAEALGLQDRLGTIEAGKMADITVLNENPLEDIKALKDVYLVIKDGNIVVFNGDIVH
ncbi:MAG: amidohydrolase family protein [Anaerolineales bacterium]|nr:amidohydrolase family protein [Anaerolineales bacterium]